MTTSSYFYSEIDICFLNFIKLGEERNHFLLMDTYCHCARRDNSICTLSIQPLIIYSVNFFQHVAYF